MKHFSILCGCLAMLCAGAPVHARGFGGGGGRIGGGGMGGGLGGGGFGGGMSRPMPMNRPSVPAYRPSTPINRSPSMSRPTNRPSLAEQRPSAGLNRPGAGPATGRPGGIRPGGGGLGSGEGISRGAAAGRPSTGDLGNFLEMSPERSTAPDRQRIQSSFDNYYRDLAARNADRRGNVADRAADVGQRLPNAGERLPDAGAATRQANVSDRMNNRQGYRSNLSDNRDNRQQQRQDWADNVRQNRDGGAWQDHWNEFKDDFGEPGWRVDYPHMANAYFRYNHPYSYWWGWASAGALNGWYAGWWTAPVYYDYGYGGSVYYGDDGVSYNGQVYSPEEYAAGAQEQAAEGEAEIETPPADGSQTAWMPLGVWALSTSELEKNPSRLFQLAVSKNGTISGTLTNTTTNDTQPIVGSVDRETQRACWYAGDRKDVVAETGIFNLTKDEAPVLIHFGPTRTEEYLLIRMPQADASSDAPAAGQAGQAPPGRPAN
jgi:hypothetical protein